MRSSKPIVNWSVVDVWPLRAASARRSTCWPLPYWKIPVCVSGFRIVRVFVSDAGRRNSSMLKKKKALPLTIGPPSRAPYCRSLTWFFPSPFTLLK